MKILAHVLPIFPRIRLKPNTDSGNDKKMKREKKKKKKIFPELFSSFMTRNVMSREKSFPFLRKKLP